MSERCQKNLIKYFDNQSLTVYSGILSLVLVLFYYYSIHFILALFSYVLGCVACYYGLRSRLVHSYIDQIKTYFLRNEKESESLQQPLFKPDCLTCGTKGCQRHYNTVQFEPWAGLQVHKQLDQAIEDFYNAVLDNFVSSWYHKISTQPFFVDELRQQLRFASSVLLRRANKVTYSKLLLERLVPCALRHCAGGVGGAASGAGGERATPPHPAVRSRRAELRYLRALATALMPHLLPKEVVDNSVVRVVVREVLSGWVLLPLADCLADPHALNALLLLTLGAHSPAPLPAEPDCQVEFLAGLVRRAQWAQAEGVQCARARLLGVQAERALACPRQLYALMRFMRATPHLHLLQLCNDIKAFQTKILNPDVSKNEETALFNEAWDLYVKYLDTESGCAIPLDPEMSQELRAVLAGRGGVRRLQTCRALYHAAQLAHRQLEAVFMPRFLHSDEFYEVFLGPRVPTAYNKHMTKKPEDRLLGQALKLGSRLRGALHSEAIEGQVLTSLGGESETDMEHVDMARYLDSLAESASLDELDLSTWRIGIDGAEVEEVCGRGGRRVHVFTVSVTRAGEAGPGSSALGTGAGALGTSSSAPGYSTWSVRRRDHDFHLLRAKLIEFHGANALSIAPPSLRDNSPVETLCYKYEDFVQRLVVAPLLRSSELVRTFLTARGEFSAALQGARQDPAGLYATLAHRLRKEKGQHLEPLVSVYLLSTDVERYQPAKQGSRCDIEEALEASDEAVSSADRRQRRAARSIDSALFGNLLDCDERAPVDRTDAGYQTRVVGFSQCLMYLLVVVGSSGGSRATRAVGGLLGALRGLADALADRLLERALAQRLCQRRLAHLVRLLHGIVFRKRSVASPEERARTACAARAALAGWAGSSCAALAGGSGGGLRRALLTALAILQDPVANKQLVYNLLDLCVAELFPELRDAQNNELATPRPTR